ncbi:MAG: hypothetical protein RJQ00_14070 [Vicingaceae bacterium]
MSGRKQKLRAYFLGLFIVLIAVNIITVSCDLITDTVDTLEEEPDRDNESDPQNPNSELASIENIRLNGLLFQLGQVPEFAGTSLSIAWDIAQDSGITDNLRFRVELASPGENLTGNYSDYFTTTSYSFQDLVLDETIDNEQYSFQIEVSSEEYSDKDPIIIGPGSFRVNNIQTSGFVILPNRIEANSSGSYTANIYLDEIVTENDLTAYRLDLIFDRSELEITVEDITVFVDEQSFLHRDGSSILQFTEVIGDTVRVESGALGNNLTPLAGGGIVAQLSFDFQGQVTSSMIRVSPTSIFKNSDGEDISITEFDTSEIVKSF